MDASFKKFSEYYSVAGNTELLSVLENPDDYLPVAVEAARDELARRQLSNEEIQEAMKPIIVRQLRKEKDKGRLQLVEKQIKGVGHEIIEILTPIQTGQPAVEKTIKRIVVVFGGVLVYQLIRDYRSCLFYLRHFLNDPVDASLYLLPILALVVAIITFWMRKRIGWTLLTIFVTHSITAEFWVIILAVTRRANGFWAQGSFSDMPSITVYIAQLVFLGGALYIISRRAIREAFSVDKTGAGITIGLTAILTIVLIAAI